MQRVPAPIIAASPPRRAFASFIGACFGDFPAGDLAYVGNDFSFLGGTKTQITPSNLLDVMWESHTPLSFGSAGIRTRGRTGPRLAVFLMRGSSADDVVDFWNLRALGWNIVPVLIDWSASLSDGVREMIAAQCRPSAALNPLATRAVLLAGRSVPNDLLTEFHQRVNPGPGFSVMHSSRPRIWAPEVRASDQTRRVELSAGEDEVEATVREDSISFSTTGPNHRASRVPTEPPGAHPTNRLIRRSICRAQT